MTYESYREARHTILRERAKTLFKERKVRCNWCEWEGSELELDIIPDATYYEVEACPECGRSDCLMDIGFVEEEEER